MRQRALHDPGAGTSADSLDSNRTALAYAPMLFTVFLFGAIIKVFPFDRDVALLSFATVIGMAVGFLPAWKKRRWIVFGTGIAVNLALLGMLFLIPWKEGGASSSTADTVEPI